MNTMVMIEINNIEGEVVKDNDVYILKDNTDLKSLVLSSTLEQAQVLKH